MKIHPLAFVAIQLSAVTAFVQPSHAFTAGKSPTELAADKNGRSSDDWTKPFIGAFAGMTVASQLAFGGLPAVASPMAPVQLERTAASSAESSGVLLSAFETMDFSMPSYSDSLNSGPGTKESSKASMEIPSFNPFGDVQVKESEQDLEKESAKKTEESKAAEKKRKEEEAAEKKRAAEAEKERKAAEKEARMKAEKEKQRQAVERAREAKEAEAAKEAPAPTPAPEPAPAPEAPKFEAPKFDAPKFDAPKFDAPKFDAPKFDAPKFDAPKFDTPKFDAPKFEAPKFNTPKFDTPKFEAPKIDTSKFEAPKFDTPKFDAPKFEAPKIPAKVQYDFGDGDEDSDVEPQEVRDERARAARLEYKNADKEAKEIEQQAREAREAANNKLKIAKEKKDDACKTKWGGKILCFRSPTIGY